MSGIKEGRDYCSYQDKLTRTIAPGMYQLNTPANDDGPCGRDIPANPHLRWQSWGPGFCEQGSTVDASSELLGLNYKQSKCPSKQYTPGAYSPTQPGVCNAAGIQDPRKCTAPTEATRLSNPPCTLRGTGINRWEWLCYDPQDKAVVPFDYLVSNRIMIKDNHAPVIEKVEDQTNAVPGASQDVVHVEPMKNWSPPTNCGASAPGNPNAEVSYRSTGYVKSVRG